MPNPRAVCKTCGHEMQEHEQRLYGTECRGEPMDDDQPRWVSGKSSSVCQCEAFVAVGVVAHAV